MNLCPDAIPRVHFRRRIQRSFLAACVSAAAFAHALDIRIDTDNLKISGDGDDGRLKGAAFRADVSNGIARFFIPGDVTIGSADTVSVAGARPAMLAIGGNAVIESGAIIDASAIGALPGPGGGAGGAGLAALSALPPAAVYATPTRSEDCAFCFSCADGPETLFFNAPRLASGRPYYLPAPGAAARKAWARFQ